MKGLSFLGILMVVTIIGITAFQGYWLYENYKREKASLELRTGITFNETVHRLQAQKLKISHLPPGSIEDLQFEMKGEREHPFNIRMAEGEELAGYLNNVTIKLRDSFLHSENVNRGLVIMKNGDIIYHRDSSKEIKIQRQLFPDDRIVRFLYGVDSLQDSIRVSEIDSAYREALANRKMDIPFTVTKTKADKSQPFDKDPMNVRIGLINPVSYQLKLGNTLGYIMKKLSPAIIFSLFLVGVTILSFVLLYRNLLRQKKLAIIKNEFISNMTHELKTPIATVGVAIEALRNFDAIHNPERTKEYLDISRNELQRLSLLVDKVLKLSMFEKKEMELKYETINLKEVVDEVVSSMKLQIEKHHADVSVQEEGDPVLQADRLHLLSLVFNLLDNSLKYSSGKPVIDVSLKEENDKVVLKIKDNGIGIAPEYQDKLFEKFFRVPSGNTHNAKGYGLGLSYAAHVVQKHGGNIYLESQPGSGSTFTIILPKNPDLPEGN